MLKKKYLKIAVSILTAAMLFASMTACGQKDAAKNSPSPSADSSKGEDNSSQQQGQSDVKTREPYEFTFYANYDWFDASPQWGQDQVSAELQKKFNITMKLAKPEGDPSQKLNIMVASDDLPDSIMMDRNSDYIRLIELDKLVALDGYIEKYPNYKQAIMPTTMNLSKVNDKVYGILNWANTDNPKARAGNRGYVINKKIYETLGSPKLESTEDLYSYLKAVKQSNMKVDGKDVVPLQSDSGIALANMIFGTFNGVMSNNYVLPINDELKFYFTSPKFEEAMIYVNKLWNEGLINKDAFIEKTEQVVEKLANGRVAVFVGTDVTTYIANQSLAKLREKDPGNDYVVVNPIAGPGLTHADVKHNTYQTLGWNVICITKKAKQPERIFELFDYMISNEGQTLLVYGPKGVLYDELDQDGFPVLKKSESELTDAERNSLGIWKWVAPGNSTFVNLAKYAANARLPKEKRDWTADMQANVMSIHNVNTDEFMNLMADPNSPEGISEKAMSDFIKKAIPKIVMSKNAEQCKQNIKESIDEAYKLGFDKVEKLYTSIWKENLKKMGK